VGHFYREHHCIGVGVLCFQSSCAIYEAGFGDVCGLACGVLVFPIDPERWNRADDYSFIGNGYEAVFAFNDESGRGGLVPEELYLHFPDIAWNWFYEFKGDRSFPGELTLIGDGRLVAAWPGNGFV
jgi:hypothetical protein